MKKSKFHINDLVTVVSGKYRGKQGQIQEIEKQWFFEPNELEIVK